MEVTGNHTFASADGGSNTVMAFAPFKPAEPPINMADKGPMPRIVEVWETHWGENDGVTRVLYSNGSVGSPSSADKWDRNGQTLTVRFASGPVDTWTISKDGKSFEGHNNLGTRIWGKLVSSG